MSTAAEDTDEYYDSPGRAPLDSRGPWFDEFLEDVGRYRAHYGGRLLKPLLLEQALWAILQYRISSGVYRSTLPRTAKAPLLVVCVLGHKLTELLTGIALPYRAHILPGLYIGHYGPTLVHGDARIGAGCNLSQGVSIGVSGRGAERGVPVIGDRVYVGTNAVIVGPVTVGDDAVVSASSLVGKDVAAGTTVVGVPARRSAAEGTAGMGLHMRARPTRSAPPPIVPAPREDPIPQRDAVP